jgi:RNA polymerase-binding transcription factor DksA
MPANLTGPRPPAAATSGRAAARPAAAGPQPVAASLPYWRALLEARWQARLRRVTELSLAFHDAAAAVGIGSAGYGDGTDSARHRLRDLLCRTVAARRAFADVEEALARLEAGRFGRCGQCAAAIPAAFLALTPEARYCPACACAARPAVVRRSATQVAIKPCGHD